MLIRQAFQTFLQLQSEGDPERRPGDGRDRKTGADAWPMDHTPQMEVRDWTLDWRWFASEAER